MTRTDKAGSQQWKAASSLFGTGQHCVAKIYNASPRANAHKLLNDPFTVSSSVLVRIHLHPETRVTTSRVWGRKETKCHDWCLEKRKKKTQNIGTACTKQSFKDVHLYLLAFVRVAI